MYLEFRERSSNWEDMHASHKVHEGICDRRTSRFLGSWCVCAQEGEGEEESAVWLTDFFYLQHRLLLDG